tara:strand:- start:300 stop:461 length:162 start_codon:yes stop_codon:yes gene_type:complete
VQEEILPNESFKPSLRLTQEAQELRGGGGLTANENILSSYYFFDEPEDRQDTD